MDHSFLFKRFRCLPAADFEMLLQIALPPCHSMTRESTDRNSFRLNPYRRQTGDFQVVFTR